MKSAFNATNRDGSGSMGSARSKMRSMTNREAPSQIGSKGRSGHMPDMTNGDVKAPRSRGISPHKTITTMSGEYKPLNGSMARSLSIGKKK